MVQKVDMRISKTKMSFQMHYDRLKSLTLKIIVVGALNIAL